jgi:hypothetical protein
MSEPQSIVNHDDSRLCLERKVDGSASRCGYSVRQADLPGAGGSTEPVPEDLVLSTLSTVTT